MAYAAPAKDTVMIVGGLGTQANAAALNGGGATKTVWDANSPSDFINTNGGPITADTAIAYDHTGGTVACMFSKAGIGTGVTVGTLAYVSGTNITTGIYEITTVAGDGSYVACANIDATDDNSDSVLNIGGALDGLQNALDSPLNDATSYNRYIYDNIATETITSVIDHNTNSGSTNTRLFIIGYRTDLTAEDDIVITTGSELANGLIQFTADVDFTEWWNIDFNGGGVGKAEYCLYTDGAVSTDKHVFKNCKFHNANNHNIYFSGRTCIWVN